MRIRRVWAAILALSFMMALMIPAAHEAQAASSYYITVDITNQIVTVYESGNVTQSGIVRQMICSTGKSSTPTPTGTYYLPSKYVSSERTEWYYFSKYNCYAKWATRITGGILFHSVLYTASKTGPTSSSVSALGSKASHGCIRLRVDDAKFIAKNCLSGTKCRIYYSGSTNSSLRSKLKNKSFIRANETYEHFLGGSQSSGSSLPLKQGSTGTLVRQLQTRLKELGFLKDTVDGIFGSKTLAAVQAFEVAAGLNKTTSVTQDLWNRIFASDAPTSGGVTLSQGSQSAAVADLQRALITLKMLNDTADGIFGAKTLAAVKKYQSTFGYDVTGTVPSALLTIILDHAARIKAEFGDREYVLTTVTTEAQLARVKVNSTLNLRQSASATSTVLAKLQNGTVLRVLERGSAWTKVAYGSQTGYVTNTYVEFYTGTISTPQYVAVEPTPSPTAEPTPEPTVEPTVEPTSEPTAEPSVEPTVEPTAGPTAESTGEPTSEPTPFMAEPPLEPEPPTEWIAADLAVPLAADTSLVGGVPQTSTSEDAAWAVVNAPGATVYARAELDPAYTLERAAAGTAFKVLSIEGEWVRVQAATGKGWILLADVTLDGVGWVYGDEPVKTTSEGAPQGENGLTIEVEDAPAEALDGPPTELTIMGE